MSTLDSYFSKRKKDSNDEEKSEPRKKKKVPASSVVVSEDVEGVKEKSSAASSSSSSSASSSKQPKEECDIVEQNRLTALARQRQLKAWQESDRSKDFPLENLLFSPSWSAALSAEWSKGYMKKLKSFLRSEFSQKKTIYPPIERVFDAMNHSHLPLVRVVLLGQDPYHGPGQAMGLSFSVNRGIAIPPSLRNMYKELSTDIEGFVPPKHGDLSSWARQGVLLLNTSLTVREAQANSHSKEGWASFTDAIIRTVSLQSKHVVFFLWGNNSKKKQNLIDSSKHLVLAGTHPSPLSASRGFFGCKHFSLANDYLVKKGRKPIDWKSVC